MDIIQTQNIRIMLKKCIFSTFLEKDLFISIEEIHDVISIYRFSVQNYVQTKVENSLVYSIQSGPDPESPILEGSNPNPAQTDQTQRTCTVYFSLYGAEPSLPHALQIHATSSAEGHFISTATGDDRSKLAFNSWVQIQ